MGRIVAFDYGKKRTGIAVTDPLKMIATPLATVPTHEVLLFLERYMQQETVEALVVGLPKNLDNTPSPMTTAATRFTKVLAKRFPQQRIFEHDERYTSKIAQASLVQGGFARKDRRNKENLDKLSATIILQSFLATQSQHRL